jgi:hypothetical protein
MEGISDVLAAQHGFAAGQVSDQQDFRLARRLKP